MGHLCDALIIFDNRSLKVIALDLKIPEVNHDMVGDYMALQETNTKKLKRQLSKLNYVLE